MLSSSSNQTLLGIPGTKINEEDKGSANNLGFVTDEQTLPPNQSKSENSFNYLEASQDQLDKSSSSDYNFKIDTNEESRNQQLSTESVQEKSSQLLTFVKVETVDHVKQ